MGKFIRNELYFNVIHVTRMSLHINHLEAIHLLLSICEVITLGRRVNTSFMRCLQAYKYCVLEGRSYKTPLTSVFDSALITEEKPVTIKGHDSHHNTMSRLVAFAKVTYHSDFKLKWKPYKYIL